MNSDLKQILLISAVIGVLILAVMGLRGITTETVVRPSVDLADPLDVDPDGNPAAVVMALLEDQDRKWFGLVGGEVRYIARVQFYAPAECASEVSQDDPWPVSNDACDSGVPVRGIVSGLGLAPSGESIIVVDALVAEACFVALSPGDRWPPSASECP